MLINNMENHKKKYAQCKSRSHTSHKQRKLQSSYYGKYIDTQSKIQKKSSSSSYLKYNHAPIQHIRQTQSKTSIKQLHNHYCQGQSSRQLKKKHDIHRAFTNKLKISTATFTNTKQAKYFREDQHKPNKIEILTMKTQQLRSPNYLSPKFEKSFQKNGFYCTKTQEKSFKAYKRNGNSRKAEYGQFKNYNEVSSNDLPQIFKSEQLFKNQPSKLIIGQKQKPKIRQTSNQNTIKQVELQFLRALKFNQVFFCRNCYRYVFAIQKHFHYPECQHKLITTDLSVQQKQKIGVSRLNMIEQLTQYTKMDNTKLHYDMQLMKKNEYYGYKYKQGQSEFINIRYLDINQVHEAVQIIYEQLMSGQEKQYKNERQSIKSGMMKLSCKNLQAINIPAHQGQL